MSKRTGVPKGKLYQAIKLVVHDWFHAYANMWCDTDEEEELIAAIQQKLITAITDELIAAITRQALVTGLLAEINSVGRNDGGM